MKNVNELIGVKEKVFSIFFFQLTDPVIICQKAKKGDIECYCCLVIYL